MGIRELLGADLVGAHVFTDFDGTLSPIVETPDAARPEPGAKEALARLKADGATVTVVSGRPVAFLEAQLAGIDLELVGLYGLESSKGGQRSTNPEATTWLPVVSDVLADARARFDDPEILIESKTFSMTIHFRGRPSMAVEVAEWASRVAAETELLARPAKMSIELHPPVSVDKGSAVRDRLRGDVAAVLMIGDDVGDLPAFQAVGEVAPEARSINVVVDSPELDPQVAEIADLTLASPAEVVAFLQS